MGHGPTIAMELCTRRPASVAGLPWPWGYCSVLHAKPNHGCPLFPNLHHSLRMLTQRVSNRWIRCFSRQCDSRYAICARTKRAGLRTCRMHTIVCVYPLTPHPTWPPIYPARMPRTTARSTSSGCRADMPSNRDRYSLLPGCPTTHSVCSVWPGRLSCTCTLPRRLQMTACRLLRRLGGARLEVEAIHTGTAPDPRRYAVLCLRVMPALRSESRRRTGSTPRCRGSSHRYCSTSKWPLCAAH